MSGGRPGLYAVGECSGGMHGSNRLGGNSLSDLLVFGRRAGEAAAAYAAGLGGARPSVSDADVEGGRDSWRSRRSTARGDRQREPVHDPAGPAADDERPGRHHPHRRGARAVAGGDREAQGARRSTCSSRGTGSTTPAGTSRSTCATCCSSRSASRRRRSSAQESRGGHTRDDFPGPNEEWGTKNLVAAARRRRHRRRPGRAAAAGDARRAEDVFFRRTRS